MLLNAELVCKISDFGTVSFIAPFTAGRVVTNPRWQAPEVIRNLPYGPSSDVYSFGMCLWEMLTQERVFADLPDLGKLVFAVCGEGHRPTIPPNCPTSLRTLIASCWDAEPKKRPSFREILEQLDHVLVDVVVQDHAARAMWKQHFWGKSAVPWEEFVKACGTSLQMTASADNEIEMACLREVLATTSKKKRIKQGDANVLRVKMTTFGNIVQCFGPYDKAFPARTAKVLGSKWFFGSASQADSEEALTQHKTTGTFMIRFSSTPGFFTLSFIGKAQLEHHRIINVPGQGCLVWGQQFKDLFAVVEAGKKTKGLLKKACAGSPYLHLFEAKKKAVKAPPQSGYMLPTEADLRKMYSPQAPGH